MFFMYISFIWYMCTQEIKVDVKRKYDICLSTLHVSTSMLLNIMEGLYYQFCQNKRIPGMTRASVPIFLEKFYGCIWQERPNSTQ